MEQWVNLPKEDKFAEDGITKERCGKIDLEVMFEKDDKPVLFKVKVSPVGSDNATYTPIEEGRNINFKLREHLLSLSEKKNVLLEESIYLPAAGGNKYKIEAKDIFGNVVTAAMEVETRRKLYYQIIKMDGLNANVPVLTSHLENEIWNELRNHYIKLKYIESKGPISKREYIDAYDAAQMSQLGSDIKAKYSDIKDPFCFVVVIIDALIASKEMTCTADATIGTACTINTTDDLRYGIDGPISPSQDRDKWYVRGSFTPDVSPSNPAPVAVPIRPEDVTFVSTRSVSVNIGSTASLPAGTSGTIILRLKGMIWANGSNNNDNNIICLATRVKWNQKRTDDEMKATFVHEVGHKIGMVPNGDGDLAPQNTLDVRPSGPHCKTSTCVIYYCSIPGRLDYFCEDCSKSIRRLDIDASRLKSFKTPA